MEQTCRTIQEEVCSDPEDPEPKTECNIVMESVCDDVVEEVCTMQSKMECQNMDKQVKLFIIRVYYNWLSRLVKPC